MMWITQKSEHPNLVRWWDKAKYTFKNIAIKRATTLNKLARHERIQLEKNLVQLQARIFRISRNTRLISRCKRTTSSTRSKEPSSCKTSNKSLSPWGRRQSTRYFYSLKKHHQASELIHTLRNENSDTLSDKRGLIAEVHSFYTNVYHAEPNDTMAQEKIFSKPPIPTHSSESRNACDAPLQSEELNNALKKMENNKSPKIDGLSWGLIYLPFLITLLTADWRSGPSWHLSLGVR